MRLMSFTRTSIPAILSLIQILVSAQFWIPQKLYGRKAEIGASLVASAYELAAQHDLARGREKITQTYLKQELETWKNAIHIDSIPT